MFGVGRECCAADDYQSNGVRHPLIIYECFTSLLKLFVDILDLLCTDLMVRSYLSILQSVDSCLLLLK